MQSDNITNELKKHNRPNVIQIIVHDTGTSYGCYGNKYVKTPHIDKLADEGVLFEKNFSTAPFCSPSRGSIITGKWPHVNGLMGLTNMGWDLPASNATDAVLFKNGGYETILCGMQHEKQSTKELGFEKIIETDSSYCIDVAPKAVDFINNRNSDEDNFYMRIGFIEAHRIGEDNLWQPYKDRAPQPEDIKVPDFLNETPEGREQHSQFYGSISAIDDAVGRILDALRESGLEDKTIFVYTTDHGIPFPKAKSTLYDNGTNTVLIMKYPKLIKEGTRFNQLISNIDLLPTLLDICGIDIPSDINGKSFSSLFRNEDYIENEYVFTQQNTQANDIKRGVRSKRWKFIYNCVAGRAMQLPIDVKPMAAVWELYDDEINADRAKFELYDLDNDKNEVSNLSGKDEYKDIENQLKEVLFNWMKDTCDPVYSGMQIRPLAEWDALWEFTKLGVYQLG